MNSVISIVLLAAVLGVIVFLLSRRENSRRSQYGPAGLSEFRTDLPLDDCFDRLDQHSPEDVFAYECRREKDGGFLLHLTLHQPTQQPVHPAAGSGPADRGHPDLHPGGLWLQGTAVPPGNAGHFYGAEAGCPPHQITLGKCFSFHAESAILKHMHCVCVCGLVAQLVRAGGS